MNLIFRLNLYYCCERCFLFMDNNPPITVAKLGLQAASGSPFTLTGKLTLVYLEINF